MPRKTGTFVSIEAWVGDLADLLGQDSEWTVDYHSGGVGTPRLHIHRAEAHFEIWQYVEHGVRVAGCTGFSGAEVSAGDQPGTSPQAIINGMYPGQQYCMIDSGAAIYLGCTYGEEGYWVWSTLFFLGAGNKFGDWDGGWGVCGGQAIEGTSRSMHMADAYTRGLATMRVDGAWTPNAQAGGLCGNMAIHGGLITGQPNQHSVDIVPLYIRIYVRDASDGSLLHPCGVAPGVFVASCQGLVEVGEAIEIGAQSYVVYPFATAGLGGPLGDILIKI